MYAASSHVNKNAKTQDNIMVKIYQNAQPEMACQSVVLHLPLYLPLAEISSLRSACFVKVVSQDLLT